MTWTTGAPFDGQSLQSSKPQIRNNFNLTYDTINENHYPPSDPLQGKHKFVLMPATTVPATLANEFAVYPKTVAGVTQLFYTSDASTNEVQISAGNTTNATQFARLGTYTNYTAHHAGGWTYLPGGLIMQYGNKTTPGNSGVITYPIPFPSGQPAFSIQVSLYRDSGNQIVTVDSDNPPTSTQFNYLSTSSGSIAVYFVAIGK